MILQRSTACLIFFASCLTLLTACHSNRNGDDNPFKDRVDVSQSTGQWPEDVPNEIYVVDFELKAEHFHGDEGVEGILPGRRLGIGPGIFAHDPETPHPLGTLSPEDQAKTIVDTMSESLVSQLQANGLSAQRIAIGTGPLPPQGWLLQGVFTEVDAGNRIKRAVIGMGKGASNMEVQVAVSDLSSSDPKKPFIVFGTVKNPKKTPGAAATLNPYVAAARFVLEKNAEEKDIRNTAGQIADEIVKHAPRFKERMNAGDAIK